MSIVALRQEIVSSSKGSVQLGRMRQPGGVFNELWPGIHKSSALIRGYGSSRTGAPKKTRARLRKAGQRQRAGIERRRRRQLTLCVYIRPLLALGRARGMLYLVVRLEGIRGGKMCRPSAAGHELPRPGGGKKL